MRVRPSLLLITTALAAFCVVQTAVGSTPVPEPARAVDLQPAAAVETRATAVVERAAAARPRPVRRHRLAVLRSDVGLSDRPGGPATGSLGTTTEFGSPRVLGVAARRGDWLGIVTSERPNGKLGWVR